MIIDGQRAFLQRGTDSRRKSIQRERANIKTVGVIIKSRRAVIEQEVRKQDFRAARDSEVDVNTVVVTEDADVRKESKE